MIPPLSKKMCLKLVDEKIATYQSYINKEEELIYKNNVANKESDIPIRRTYNYLVELRALKLYKYLMKIGKA